MSLWHAGVDFLISILEALQSVTGSYGVAIILITIIVRVLLLPLTHKQMASMAAMQTIQPRMKVLQEKYGNDKQKLNEEMMRLYKENKVNPFAGCFPLLIQLPIMILLFQSLMRFEVHDITFFGIQLEQSILHGMGEALSVLPEDGSPIGFFAVIGAIFANPAGLSNVSLYLPSLILMIVICFLTWFQQKLSGSANNPQMATMNVIMPIMMGFICLSLPGGVLIYWGTSSLIGIVQQWFSVRKAKAAMATKPTLYKDKPGQYSNPKTLEEYTAKKKTEAYKKQDEEEYEDDEYDDDDDEFDFDDYEYEDDEHEDGKKSNKNRRGK